MNIGAPWPDLAEAAPRVLAMQAKLHHWATSDMTAWRAGCGESRTSGSEGGPRNRTDREAGTAPRPDPYTKLLGPAKWTYFSLYVLLDSSSRYVTGWLLADREQTSLAERLIAEAATQQGITAGQLTLHADRGSSMTSEPVAWLLADLGILKTHARPHVSDDNPYSEAQFKTLKYRPDFPARFESIEGARAFCRAFFPWYNTEHRHSGLGLLPPAVVHAGQAEPVRAARA